MCGDGGFGREGLEEGQNNNTRKYQEIPSKYRIYGHKYAQYRLLLFTLTFRGLVCPSRPIRAVPRPDWACVVVVVFVPYLYGIFIHSVCNRTFTAYLLYISAIYCPILSDCQPIPPCVVSVPSPSLFSSSNLLVTLSLSFPPPLFTNTFLPPTSNPLTFSTCLRRALYRLLCCCHLATSFRCSLTTRSGQSLFRASRKPRHPPSFVHSSAKFLHCSTIARLPKSLLIIPPARTHRDT
jgi:hypothetical protein